MSYPATLYPTYVLSPTQGVLAPVDVPEFIPEDGWLVDAGARTARNLIIKLPIERFPVSMDFSNHLGPTETIVSATVVNEPSIPGDGIAETGATDIQGDKVAFWISAGTDKYDYRVEVRATTNQGRVRALDGTCQVRNR